MKRHGSDSDFFVATRGTKISGTWSSIHKPLAAVMYADTMCCLEKDWNRCMTARSANSGIDEMGCEWADVAAPRVRMSSHFSAAGIPMPCSSFEE
jgi:hypothetical protein